MPRCYAVLLVTSLLFFFVAVVRSQPAQFESNPIQSVSGQFTVAASGGFSWLQHSPAVAANPNLLQLEPALLAVAAERLKMDLWRMLGYKPDAAWRGKIFLALQPSHSLADRVTITSGRVMNHWNYRVELPDVLPATRYVRSLAGVLLLEIANRTATAHSAEIPAWLVDGLAQQILATDAEKVLLTIPTRNAAGLPQSPLVKKERGRDALVQARLQLKNSPALMFEPLCWPTDAQVEGADGGGYQASAQLFVASLLDLKDGRDCLRNFLAQTPGCLNWQTAFFDAFHEHFRTPLDVEKWWALRVLDFAAHDPGPRWTLAVSREHLLKLLSVPVEFRTDSNALPVRAEVTLQVALRNFTGEQLARVLAVKQRDLELAQLRLAPPFAPLAGSYRKILADFLGQTKTPAAAGTRNSTPAMRRRTTLEDTLKQLDALDARRREAEGNVRNSVRP